MVQIELSAEEAAELVRVLEEYLGDLRAEISDTDSSFFKEGLREEKGVIKDVLSKLHEVTTTTQS
ncbi:hypothetical protein [Caldilinea sp.]|uniref:hypothetical protein n=1 Tax=Caldilinea sp. TaxID=2293560 RepID=UPI002C720ADB|nr:hypothetical protein [Caldilinea sp.]HRA64922.1 hypothetical protein [Caldilinea sp.]